MYDIIPYFVTFSDIYTLALALVQPPLVTPFWRTYEGEDDHYTLIVQTIPIFANVPDPKKVPIPKLGRHDVGSKLGYRMNFMLSTYSTSTESTTPPSPSEHAFRQLNQ